jgi:hypothetical protein
VRPSVGRGYAAFLNYSASRIEDRDLGCAFTGRGTNESSEKSPQGTDDELKD